MIIFLINITLYLAIWSALILLFVWGIYILGKRIEEWEDGWINYRAIWRVRVLDLLIFLISGFFLLSHILLIDHYYKSIILNHLRNTDYKLDYLKSSYISKNEVSIRLLSPRKSYGDISVWLMFKSDKDYEHNKNLMDSFVPKIFALSKIAEDEGYAIEYISMFLDSKTDKCARFSLTKSVVNYNINNCNTWDFNNKLSCMNHSNSTSKKEIETCWLDGTWFQEEFENKIQE